MIYEKEILIENDKGLHTRASALIAFKAAEINKKYGVNLFIKRTDRENRIPIASMLALTALGIRWGDRVVISCEGESGCMAALDEMEGCLAGQLEAEKADMDEIDKVMDKNTLTSESVVETISNGVIVVDEDNRVILFNKAAERITGIRKDAIIGKNANEVFEGFKLHEALASGKKSAQDKLKLGNNTVITGYDPIIAEGNIIGAVAVFQDISELERISGRLESVMEIKEQFGNIINYAGDGICMVDENGIITYVNPEFERIWSLKGGDIVEKDIRDILPDSAIVKVMQTCQKQLGFIDSKNSGARIISNASPIMINGTFKGVVALFEEETQLQKVIQKLNETEEKLKYLKEELDRKQKLPEAFTVIVGNSGTLQDVLHIASKAAKTSSTVLIYGESGTGKELLAGTIAAASARKDKPFIRINCAAIPEGLLESELFGHVRGAFTGATNDKFGKFELADGGTIFLDEIGDMSKDMQVKLLRVLQEREFERLGGTRTIRVNVRVIAATNKNLERMVKDEQFREDLYYRLNVIPITLPPLRDRKGDIPLLVEHFAEKMCRREGIQTKKISPEVMEYLRMYNWPGNIRELENIIERMIALNEGSLLGPECLPSYMNVKGRPLKSELINLVDDELALLEEYEKSVIRIALEKYKSFNKAGKVLGITHRAVALKARRYGLI